MSTGIAAAIGNVRRFLDSRLPVFVNQLVNQFVFLTAGKIFFRLSVTWLEIILLLASSLLMELALLKLFSPREKIRFPLTALSTGFNYVFMLGVTNFFYYLPGLFAGLLQKHIFRKLSGAHFQNPSNLAIVVTLLLFPANSFITVRDWGSTAAFAAIAVFLGVFLLFRLGILIIPLAFFFFDTLFKFTLLVSDLQILLSDFFSAAVILFSFFMITDPKTIPAKVSSRIVYAMLIALFDTLLNVFLGVKEVNLFLSLTLAQFSVPLFRYFEQEKFRSRRPAIYVGAAAAVCAVLVGIFFSSWNIIRNTEKSISASYALTQDVQYESSTLKLNPEKRGSSVFKHIEQRAYKTRWAKPHMERFPFSEKFPNTGKLRFGPVPLPPLTDNLSAENLGDYAMLYSGVAAGDINHDGFQDVILNKLHQPLVVWINDRGKGFLDQTTDLFETGKVPANVEHVALADLNNDSYLDLVAVTSARYGSGEVLIYEFNPEAARFIRVNAFAVGKHASGGLAFHDLNRDGKLDFFVSYGVNVFSPVLDMHLIAQPDTLFVSSPAGYRESIANYFPGEYVRDGFAGMTAQFTDYNADGHIDLLLGNDFDDPSIVFRGLSNGQFAIESRKSLGFNTQLSMSFLAADFDNDGVDEIFEAGVSERFVPYRTAYGHPEGAARNSALDRDMALFDKSKEKGVFECEKAETPVGKKICREYSFVYGALRTGDMALCERVEAEQIKASCKRLAHLAKHAFSAPSPSRYKYDVEKFPKQLRENILWRKGGEGYSNILSDCPEAKFTGFSFASFPFDVNNDGRLDLYVTNGFLLRSHNENALLMNSGRTAGDICFSDAASAASVNLQKDGRGVVVADFDNDGDGDILVASYLQGADFFRNEFGGKSIALELRSHSGNYFGIGAEVRLYYTGGVQKRFVTIGGIWGTSQPAKQHFGIPANTRIEYAEITWPNGKKDRRYNLQTGYRFVIYE